MYNRERYEWLLDKAQKELPDIEVVMETLDLGHQIGFAFKKGDKVTASIMWSHGGEVGREKEYLLENLGKIIKRTKDFFA